MLAQHVVVNDDNVGVGWDLLAAAVDDSDLAVSYEPFLHLVGPVDFEAGRADNQHRLGVGHIDHADRLNCLAKAHFVADQGRGAVSRVSDAGTLIGEVFQASRHGDVHVAADSLRGLDGGDIVAVAGDDPCAAVLANAVARSLDRSFALAPDLPKLLRRARG